jgi:hypothetical protein
MNGVGSARVNTDLITIKMGIPLDVCSSLLAIIPRIRRLLNKLSLFREEAIAKQL